MDSKLEIVLTAKDVTGKAFQQVRGRIDAITKSVFSLQGGLVTLAGGYGLKSIATAAVDVASSFEQMEVKLDALTRGRGAETLDEINKWALAMPVNTMKAVDTFAMMQAMGLEPTIDKMETLVDVAAIFGEEAMPRVARAMGQMQTLGKLSAEELNQMAEAGINARKYITEAFGATVEEVQKSGVEIEKIVQAIWQGLDADYSGAAAQAQKSWQGLTNTFKSYMTEITREVMDAGVFDELKEQLEDINDLTSRWLEANRDLIRIKVPEYIDSIKEALKKIWEVVTYDPAIIEWGVVGLAIGGKKGAVLLGGIAHTMTWAQNLATALDLAQQGVIEYSEIVRANFKELEELVENGNEKLRNGQVFKIGEMTPGWDAYKASVENTNKSLETTKITLDQIVVSANKVSEAWTWTDTWGASAMLTDPKIQASMEQNLSAGDNTKQWAEIRSASDIGLNLWMPSDEEFTGIENAAKDVQEVYTSMWQRIADTAASALQQMMDGTHDLQATVSDFLKGGGQSLFSQGMMSGNWYMMAGGAAMMGAGSIMGDGGPGVVTKMIDELKNLQDSLDDFSETLDKDIYMLGDNLGAYASDIYDANKRLADTLEDISRQTGKSKFVTGESLFQPLSGEGTNLFEASMEAFKAEMATWDNYLKEIFIITKKSVDDIKDYLTDLRVDKTDYMLAMENAMEGYDEISATAAEALRLHGTATERLQSLYDRLAEVPEIDYDALYEAAYITTGRTKDNPEGTNTVWSLKRYDMLVSEAKDARQAVIDAIETQIDAVSGILTPEDLAYYTDLLGADSEVIAKINAEFADRRSGINIGIDRYMAEITGTATELDQALWGVNDRFDAWVEALTDTFDPLSQAVELGEELARVETLRAQAIDATTDSVLNNINAEQSAAALAGGISSLSTVIKDLTGGSLAPVSSADFFSQQYDLLLGAALTAPADEMAGSISDLVAYLPDYLDYMKAYGGYSDMVTEVVGDLTDVQQRAIDEATKIDQNWQDLLSYTEQIMLNTSGGLAIPAAASGGLTSGVTIAGELGPAYPEWIVPTYEPQRSAFLRDVGVDPAAIGATIARNLAPLIAQTGGGSGDIRLHLYIDGREVRKTVTAGMNGRDPELIRATRRAANG